MSWWDDLKKEYWADDPPLHSGEKIQPKNVTDIRSSVVGNNQPGVLTPVVNGVTLNEKQYQLLCAEVVPANSPLGMLLKMFFSRVAQAIPDEKTRMQAIVSDSELDIAQVKQLIAGAIQILDREYKSFVEQKIAAREKGLQGVQQELATLTANLGTLDQQVQANRNACTQTLAELKAKYEQDVARVTAEYGNREQQLVAQGQSSNARVSELKAFASKAEQEHQATLAEFKLSVDKLGGILQKFLTLTN